MSTVALTSARYDQFEAIISKLNGGAVGTACGRGFQTDLPDGTEGGGESKWVFMNNQRIYQSQARVVAPSPPPSSGSCRCWRRWTRDVVRVRRR